MRRFILGSGLMGLIAKLILGNSWQLIPFGKSRFYSFTPPLSDNFIIQSSKMNTVLAELGYLSDTLFHQRVFSFVGQLIFSQESFVKQAFIEKLFGTEVHPLAGALLHTSENVYRTRASELYTDLLSRFKVDIMSSIAAHGPLLRINDHSLVTQNRTIEFDQIVSTIPLDVLYNLRGISVNLPSRDVWYYHVNTSSIDLEKADEALVVDKPFDFFKVVNIKPNEYVFYCLRDLGNPVKYLSAFIGNQLTILNTTTMQKAIPLGAPPKLSNLESAGIYPVGCHAQWDYFMDLASSVNRLIGLPIYG